MPDSSHPFVQGRPRRGLGHLAFMPPTGTPMDVVENRLALIHLALAAAERLLEESAVPLSEVRQRLLQASMRTFRNILREHAATPSGHCQVCRFPMEAHYPRFAWPCPTVELVEATLLELDFDSDHEQGNEDR